MRYKFYVNVQTDHVGRNIGFFGYLEGHSLALAYEGEFERIPTDYESAGEQLYTKFNVMRPSDYRGPSMSVGDVIVIDDANALSVETFGFRNIPVPDPSVLKPTPSDWRL